MHCAGSHKIEVLQTPKLCIKNVCRCRSVWALYGPALSELWCALAVWTEFWHINLGRPQLRSSEVPLGLKSAKDLSFGRREAFLARYERANALPARPRVRRARVCPFFPLPQALAAVAPPKGRQLGAKCPHEGRRRLRTPSFSRTRPPKGDLCGTWSVHA